MMRVAIVNDTSIYNSHFGCQLVGQTMREQFARIGAELVFSFGKFKEDELDLGLSLLEKVDLVVVNGEGRLHHGKGRFMLDLAERFPCALINCVYQDNEPHPGLRRFKYIAARESLSAGFLASQGVEAKVVPDLCFASAFLRSYPRRKPTNEIGVSDNVTSPKSGFPPKTTTVAEYLNTLSSYKGLCLGRFHAVVAASVLQIPFTAWPSNTWKIEGMLGDMGASELWFPTLKEAKRNLSFEVLSQVTRFAQDAKRKVEGMFDDLAQLR